MADRVRIGTSYLAQELVSPRVRETGKADKEEMKAQAQGQGSEENSGQAMRLVGKATDERGIGG